MSYQVAIFDMDGTILDTLEDLADSVNYSLQQYHMPLHSTEDICRYVGNGIHKLIERAVLEGTDDTTLEQVFTCFRDYYKDHCAIKTKPYSGILDVIQSLRQQGIFTAVVSNKAEFAVQSLCDDYFPDLFDVIVGDKAGRRIKPYPDGVNYVIEHFGVAKENVIYIGDSEVDYQTAQNAEIDSIIVGWGFRDEDYLKSLGVKQVIHNPKEILSFFSEKR